MYLPKEISDIYDQVTQNISWGEALLFTGINPGINPIILNPDQFKIVNGQLDQLSDAYRARAKNAFSNAVKTGRVICPACGG